MSPMRRTDGRRRAPFGPWGGAVAVTVAPLVGCHAPMSIFGAAGPEASRIAWLTWGLVIVAAVVTTTVLALLLAGIRRNGEGDATVDPSPRSTAFVTVGGIMLPGALLLAVLLVGLGVLHRLRLDAAGQDVVFKLTGHQWWWEVEYRDPVLAQRFRSANEIHVPVGRVVRLDLASADVIHSFWVPSMRGKRDLIPGEDREIRFIVTQPGTYRGQCAEYCGTQHAHMALTVVAEDEASFQRWLAAQRAVASEPSDTLAAMGERLVTAGTCALCHAVRGTPAAAGVAPDLTHVGSRSTIAAGMLPNSLGNMEAWIANAQSLKPGVRMPTMTRFSGTELRAIATYLQELR